MLPLSSQTTDFLTFARQWSKLLAAGNFAQACALLDKPGGDGLMWTPKLLQRTVEDTFGPGTRFRLAHPEGVIYSDPDDLPLPPANRATVGHYQDGSGYWLSWDLPLNGAWSDLTAMFEFKRGVAGFSVCLHDLHVL